MRLSGYFWLMVVLLLSPLAQAQDANEDLYDGVAPADSVFVRVFNLGSTAIGFDVSGKQRAQRVAAGQLGGYRFTTPGRVKMGVEGRELEVELPQGSAATVLYRDGQLLLIKDLFGSDPRKAQVGFYNLTSQTVALKTGDGKHLVVEELAPDTTGMRAVNELKIGFSAYAGERELARFNEEFLKLGNTYSFMLVESAGGLRTVSTQNLVDMTE